MSDRNMALAADDYEVSNGADPGNDAMVANALPVSPDDTGLFRGDVSPPTTPKAVEILDVSGVSPGQGGGIKGIGPELRKPLTHLLPWDEPVDGANLLKAMVSLFNRHLVLPPGGAEIIALWVLFAHTLDAHSHSPRLMFRSPMNGCGKSNALSLIKQMVPTPMPCSSATPAVIYRAIELHQPTLLFDEADNFLRRNLEYREIMNSGHSLDSAFVARSAPTASGDWEPKFFSTWAACVIAWNEEHGKVWPTLRSRCLDIPMKRRKPSEDIKDITSMVLAGARELGRKASRWAQDNINALRGSQPAIPGVINRLADNWRPLLAVADAVGSQWPDLARTLPDADAAIVPELSVELLRDIQGIIAGRPNNDRIGSLALCNALASLDDRPWATYNDRGADLKITQDQLAAILDPFDVSPKPMRLPGHPTTKRGYLFDWFEDPIERYAPIPTPSEGETGETSNDTSSL